jgi:DNA polymerase III alpha subunit (gram-positive type)
MDTETTGLSPAKNEIIEIALVTMNSETMEEIDRYCSKIAPEHIELADERALLINHYSWQAWVGAPDLGQVIKEMAPFFDESHIICGHNIPFDIAFVEETFRRVGMEPPKYAGIIDTKRLAKTLNIQSPSFRLGALCQKMGIRHENAHTAMDDIEANIELFKRIKSQYNVTISDAVQAAASRKTTRMTKDLYL